MLNKKVGICFQLDLRNTKTLSGVLSCLIQHKTDLLDIQILYQVNLYS